MKIKKIWLTSTIILSITVIFGIIKMRKNFPYDFEIVQLKGSLGLTNITHWADRDCVVTVEGDMIAKKKFEMIFPQKTIRIDGLTLGNAYKISISRKDILGQIKYRPIEMKVLQKQDNNNYVVLIGASVGKKWDLPNLAQRKNIANICYGYRGIYEFDKGPIVNDLIKSPIKPDIVIIKQCAQYFPRNTKKGLDKIQEWAKMLLDNDIQPVLATVVPVTEDHDLNKKSGRMDSINAFNKEIRNFGKNNNYPVLDLQEVLAKNDKKGYLDEKYSMEDGLHLKRGTYLEILDNHLKRFINNALNNELN